MNIRKKNFQKIFGKSGDYVYIIPYESITRNVIWVNRTDINLSSTTGEHQIQLV